MADLKNWSRERLDRLKRDMDRMFDSYCADLGLEEGLLTPEFPVTVIEDDRELVLRVVVPGMEPQNMSLVVNDRWARLTGCLDERFEGCAATRTFRKEFTLPCRIRPEDVAAVFDDGIIEIHMPKCVPATTRTVPILKK